MKHYRILEKKGDKKEYIIQYLKKFIFGLYFWKKVQNGGITYTKYEDAFNFVKKLINQEDYDNLTFGYHYIDAYKILKTQTKEVQKDTFIKEISTSASTDSLEIKQTRTKSTFIPRQNQVPGKKINKSVFIPKQK